MKRGVNRTCYGRHLGNDLHEIHAIFFLGLLHHLGHDDRSTSSSSSLPFSSCHSCGQLSCKSDTPFLDFQHERSTRHANMTNEISTNVRMHDYGLPMTKAFLSDSILYHASASDFGAIWAIYMYVVCWDFFQFLISSSVRSRYHSSNASHTFKTADRFDESPERPDFIEMIPMLTH